MLINIFSKCYNIFREKNQHFFLFFHLRPFFPDRFLHLHLRPPAAVASGSGGQQREPGRDVAELAGRRCRCFRPATY
jgi:hypothetical protein